MYQGSYIGVRYFRLVSILLLLLTGANSFAQDATEAAQEIKNHFGIPAVVYQETGSDKHQLWRNCQNISLMTQNE